MFAGCNLPELYATRQSGAGRGVLPPDVLARIQGQAPLLAAMRAMEAEGVLVRQDAKYRLAASLN